MTKVGLSVLRSHSRLHQFAVVVDACYQFTPSGSLADDQPEEQAAAAIVSTIADPASLGHQRLVAVPDKEVADVRTLSSSSPASHKRDSIAS